MSNVRKKMRTTDLSAMYRIEVAPAKKQALEQTYKTMSDWRLRDRCQAVLMVVHGRQRKQVKQDIGVHRSTLRLWLQRYCETALERLQIHWAPGNLTSSATDCRA